jgi:hypothetical protein
MSKNNTGFVPILDTRAEDMLAVWKNILFLLFLSKNGVPFF